MQTNSGDVTYRDLGAKKAPLELGGTFFMVDKEAKTWQVWPAWLDDALMFRDVTQQRTQGTGVWRTFTKKEYSERFMEELHD